MDNHTDTRFLHRISSIENDLLNLNRSSLDTFNQQWTTFVVDLKAAVDAKSLNDSTITKAHALAGRVSQMVQTFFELEVLAERLMSSLLDETSTILSTSSIDTPTPSAEPSGPASGPSYIKPAYDWLLDNLHNPYPSTRIRDGMSQKSGAARKDVDNWFIDARKRIGWNALRKSWFSNKRVEIVDAATRFFVEDDPKRSLDPSIEYEFIAIKKCAKDLYVDKFSESDLAATLDMAVKNLTPQTKAEAKTEQLRQWQLRKDRESYPSPDRSPEPTRLSPVPYNDDHDTNAAQSISVTGRKRRSPSADTPDHQEPEHSADRPTKRSRLDIPSLSPKGLAFPTSLPSPAASVDEPLQAAETSDSSPLLAQSTVAAPNRKRRLSDSDGQGAPKRPRNLPVGPRLHVVSDPLPLSSALFDASAFDGWFQQHFDLQTAPHVGEISPCGFDVELGNLSDFDCETQTESASGSPRTAQEGSELPTVEVNSTELQVQNSDLPSEFSFGYLQSLLSTGVNTNFQHIAPQAQDFSIPQITSLGLDFLNDFGSTFHIPIEPTPAVNDYLSASAAAPSFDFQWELSDYLNIGPQGHVSHPGKGLDVPQNGLGFLPPLLMPNSTELLPPSGGDYLASLQAQAVRKEKEMKLKQMKEEALRLELELATSA